MSKANDTQIGGEHYKKLGLYQPWDVLRHWLTAEEYRGWQKGTIMVYLAREGDKNGDEDIKKAGHHLQKLIEVIGENATIEALGQATFDAHKAVSIAGDARMIMDDVMAAVETAQPRTLDPDAWAPILTPEHLKRSKALVEGITLDQLGDWSDGPDTYIIVQAKDVCLGAQSYHLKADAVQTVTAKELAAVGQEIEANINEMQVLRAKLLDMGADNESRLAQRVDKVISLLVRLQHPEMLAYKVKPLPEAPAPAPRGQKRIIFCKTQDEMDKLYSELGQTDAKRARCSDTMNRQSAYAQIHKFVTGKADTLVVLHHPGLVWPHMRIPAIDVDVRFNGEWGMTATTVVRQHVLNEVDSINAWIEFNPEPPAPAKQKRIVFLRQWPQGHKTHEGEARIHEEMDSRLVNGLIADFNRGTLHTLYIRIETLFVSWPFDFISYKDIGLIEYGVGPWPTRLKDQIEATVFARNTDN